jgi:hypothetical protein
MKLNASKASLSRKFLQLLHFFFMLPFHSCSLIKTLFSPPVYPTYIPPAAIKIAPEGRPIPNSLGKRITKSF